MVESMPMVNDDDAVGYQTVFFPSNRQNLVDFQRHASEVGPCHALYIPQKWRVATY